MKLLMAKRQVASQIRPSVNMRNFADNTGRVTPGGLMVIALIGGAVWFTQQPKSDQPSIACKPMGYFQRWAEVQEKESDPLATPFNKFIHKFTANCPENLGKQAKDLSAQATNAVGQAMHHAKAVGNRKVEAVVDGEHLKLFSVGQVRLLGITVPPEQGEQAKAYLQEEVGGKSVAVTIDKDLDAERRPLVLITLDNGDLLNATMIHRGLARPWTTDGPWREWTHEVKAQSEKS